MKKILFTIAIIATATASSFSQSEKYTAAMKTNIAALDSAMIKNNMADLANNFERIALAEKNQWLPFYYAAYATVSSTYNMTDKSKVDAIADKAESFLKKAEELAGGENSEICVVKSMIASGHLMVDPQNRWMEYGQVSGANIEKAKKLDPTNPRPFYLDGQSKFYTPEAFGGGKTVAKPILEKAYSMFTTFKPASELHPSWGKNATQYFIGLCN
ncbi:MAG: hypothetical protein H7Y27_09285 [Gemmatimonadaceae bacterium]|nr:hypothetical protein [Chitinophagaceae bacterium]